MNECQVIRPILNKMNHILEIFSKDHIFRFGQSEFPHFITELVDHSRKLNLGSGPLLLIGLNTNGFQCEQISRPTNSTSP